MDDPYYKLIVNSLYSRFYGVVTIYAYCTIDSMILPYEPTYAEHITARDGGYKPGKDPVGPPPGPPPGPGPQKPPIPPQRP